MYSLAIIFSFISIWCLFATSKKVEHTKTGITLLLANNTKVAKIASLVLFLVTIVLLSYCMGFVTGLLTSIVLWMFLASCIVLFAPFKLETIQIIAIISLIVGLEFVSTFYF